MFENPPRLVATGVLFISGICCTDIRTDIRSRQGFFFSMPRCLKARLRASGHSARPTLSQFCSFTTFLNYIRFADLLIVRLWNCERADREVIQVVKAELERPASFFYRTKHFTILDPRNQFFNYINFDDRRILVLYIFEMFGQDQFWSLPSLRKAIAISKRTSVPRPESPAVKRPVCCSRDKKRRKKEGRKTH